MQYRKFGRLDWQGSALGFGCMRLPLTDKANSASIDEAEATRMVRHAIEHGVTYLDSAYGYHGGESERFVGRVLKDGYRDKVKLATKLPTWLVKAAEDFDRYLDEQLGKLQTDHIDFYLLHGLNSKRWPVMVEANVIASAQKAIADGRIRRLGFSFHDNLDAFKQIVDAHTWDFCQIQYNYMDINNQAGTKGLQYAASKGLGVVIMEPLLGGRLVNPPKPVQAVWDTATTQRKSADWALQWVWNQPEVSVVLSGMSTLQQVQENLASAGASRIGALSEAELDLIGKARAKYEELCPIPCTACEYCLPCPNGVNIPRVFKIYNQGAMYEDAAGARREYTMWTPEAERANKCKDCNECEEKCPQTIPISEWMPRVHKVLGEGVPYEECA